MRTRQTIHHVLLQSAVVGAEQRIALLERCIRKHPLEPLTQPTAIFIAGREQPLESRATELGKRYTPAR